MRVLPALAGLLLLLAGACGGGQNAPPSTKTPTPVGASPAATVAAACAGGGRGAPAGTSEATIMSGGLARRYVLHVPPSYDAAAPVPLVLALHPASGNAALMLSLTRFAEMADGAGFVVVAPEGTGDPQFWNIARYQAAADDVAFLRELIGRLDAELCLDQNRTYVTGYSNGGGMALRMACEMPDRIAAVAVVASQYVSCDAAVPLIAFHGTLDPLLPFEGGSDPEVPGATLIPVRRAVSEWARQLGCDGLARISVPSSEVELSTFQRCRFGAGEALLYTIIGGGHTWPGALPVAESALGKTTQQLDATRVMWDFFAAHPHVR
jgi:polyhydroxybutyrate depolymerase